jgi:hypothetical protein
MIRVSIAGWNPGLKSISLMKLLREGSQSERTLAEAKSLVDGLLEGRSFTITFPSQREAEIFLKEATDLGVVGTIANGKG